MGLSADLIEQFVKVTNDTRKEKVDTTTFGTTVVKDDKVYVKLDGSELYTPVSTTTHLNDGERVMVTIKNHTAIVTGNMSSPAVNLETEVSDGENGSVKIVNLGISMRDGFVKIDNLMAENFEAVNATIENLNSKYATIENLEATNATIGKLDAKYATIENLNAATASIGSLTAELGSFKNLTADNFTAVNGSISNLQTKKLDAEQADIKYAQIDFANIGEAAIKNFIAESGIIKELTVSDGYITHELIGVKIKGDLIEANTLVADKLVILGDDGLYYKLNTDGESITSSQTEYNSLNGSVITAKSVTAEKIKVDDLQAFGATIGGFKITTNSIYSGSKATVGNTTRGIYLDNDGQIALGDSSNYLKFYKDGNDYKLAISADSVLFGSNKKSIDTAIKEAVDDVEVGGRNLLPNSDVEKVASPKEFLQYADLAPVFDEYGLVEYTLSFDIKSADTSVQNTVQVYCQNGSSTKHTFTMPNGSYFKVPVTTEYTRQSIVFTPRMNNESETKSMLAFFGVYDSGNIPYVKNVKIEKGNKATDWTPAPEDVDAGISAAQSTANTAKTDAATAQSTANTARQEASNAAKTATDFIEASDKGLTVGNMTGSTLGRNVLIGTQSVDIRNGDEILASYGDSTIYLGKHSENAVINLCDGSATMQLGVDTFFDQPIYQINSDYGLNLNSMFQIHGSTSYSEDLSWGGSYFRCRSHDPLVLPSSRENPSLVSKAIGGVFEAVGYSRINTSTSNRYSTWSELHIGEGSAYIGVCSDDGIISVSPSEWDTQIRLTSSKIFLEAPYISLNAPDGISIESSITLDNEQIIYGVDASYNVVPVFQPQNEYGNTVVGYGNYTKNSSIINDSNKGNTNIYGQNVQLFSKEDVKLFVNGSDEGFRPYYRKGDSITLLWYGAGYISSSSSAVYISIPLGKPVIGSPNVNVENNEGICVRQGGHYCFGATSDKQYVEPSGYSNIALAADGTQVRMRINMPNTTNAINNDACGVAASIKITFS